MPEEGQMEKVRRCFIHGDVQEVWLGDLRLGFGVLWGQVWQNRACDDVHGSAWSRRRWALEGKAARCEAVLQFAVGGW
jgi:hypothetical protein